VVVGRCVLVAVVQYTCDVVQLQLIRSVARAMALELAVLINMTHGLGSWSKAIGLCLFVQPARFMVVCFNSGVWKWGVDSLSASAFHCQLLCLQLLATCVV
jgi:hypothetical protein